MIDPPGSEAAAAQRRLGALWQAFATHAEAARARHITFHPAEAMVTYEGLVSQYGLLVSAFSTDAWKLVEICFDLSPRNPDFELPRYWEFEGDIEAARQDACFGDEALRK